MKLPQPRLSRSQLATLVGLAAVLAVACTIAWGFAQQLALARQLRDEERELERVVATERAQHENLVAQLEHVQSDAYVEEWARTEARMVKSGEVAVVLVDEPDEQPATEPKSTPSPEPEPRSFWADLWELIFPPTQ